MTMRRGIVLVLATCGLSLGLSLGLALAPAPPAGSAGVPDQRARLKCFTGVVGVDGTGHVRADVIRNDKVTTLRRSGEALPFDVTGWGLYDIRDTRQGEIIRLDAVAADGTPRRVTLDVKGKSKVGVGSSPYDQTGFAPRLFADGFGFYAYTVNDSGKLQRWSLTRFRNGDLRFADKVDVGSGYAGLTALQASTFFTHKGVEREYLYATTVDGALQQIAVPVKKPRKEKVRTLKSSGYAGVTELAWSRCNGNDEYTSLVAIDPTANTATWTTVRNSVTKPRAKLRGPVTGGADWNLSAVY